MLPSHLGVLTMRTVFINAQGRPVYTAWLAHEQDIPPAPEGFTTQPGPDGVSDEALLSGYVFYANEWHQRPSGVAGVCVFDGSNWVDPRPLSELKALRWTAIKGDRETQINTPLVTPFGSFDADPASRSNISDAVLLMNNLVAAGQSPTITYTLHDNAEVVLTAAQMVTVGLLLGQKVQTAFGTARTLRASIDAATTAVEVAAVSWPE